MEDDIIDSLYGAIRTVPDFPIEGIMFRDITPVLADGELLTTLVDRMVTDMDALGWKPDDIALPKGAALLAIERLRYCGFRVNVDKTFVHGPFRESCGADFFEGIDVRPFVLDYLPIKLVDLVKIANGLQARGRSFPATVKCCMDLTPKEHLLLKPSQTGAIDDAIQVPLDTFMGNGSAIKWDRERQTWNFKVWKTLSADDEKIVLCSTEQALAMHHGSTPVRAPYRKDLAQARNPAREVGTPSLPLRFTTRTKRQWYLPRLKSSIEECGENTR